MLGLVVVAAALGTVVGVVLSRLVSRYPGETARLPPWVVVLLSAATFAVLAARFGWDWALPAYLYLGAISVLLAVIDLATRRLPNAIVLPSYAIGGLLLLLPSAVEPDWGAYLRAWLGAAALFAFYFLLALIYPAGMGFGDVKLAGVLGLYLGWLGWGELAVGAFLGFLIGAMAGVGLIAAGRAGRKTAIPFGPSMLLGALIAVLFGGNVADAYFQTCCAG
jgi:leader peptidase (prepilin peptidase)/N-methyltransferase